MSNSLAPENLIRFTHEGDTLIGQVETQSMMSMESPVIGDAILDETKRVGDDLRNLVIDLGAVKSMNSAALGMLFAVHATMLRSSVEFCLVGVSPFIRQILASIRADSVFRVFDGMDDFREAVRPG